MQWKKPTRHPIFHSLMRPSQGHGDSCPATARFPGNHLPTETRGHLARMARLLNTVGVSLKIPGWLFNRFVQDPS